MKRVITLFAVLAAALASVTAVSGPAQAQTPTIDRAKAQCIVGEQIDGFLGFVDAAEATDALRREVRDINQKRSAAYQRIAERNNVTPREAAMLTAERLINSAPSGHCVQNEKGRWVRVP